MKVCRIDCWLWLYERILYFHQKPLVIYLSPTDYLGVTCTETPRWGAHCSKIAAKANKSLGLIRGSLKPWSVEVKERAYMTLVRPTLEYFSSSWNHYTDKIYGQNQVYKISPTYLLPITGKCFSFQLSIFPKGIRVWNCSLISLPADVLRGLFVTHSFLPHGRLLNTPNIYVHQPQAV